MATEKSLTGEQVVEIICSVVIGNKDLENLFISTFKKVGEKKCQSKK